MLNSHSPVYLCCALSFWQRSNRETRRSPAPNCKREGVKFHFIMFSFKKSLSWKRPPSIYGFRQILPTHPCYYIPRLHPPRTTLGTGKYVITTLKTVFFKNLFRKCKKAAVINGKTWENFIIAHLGTNWALDTLLVSINDLNNFITYPHYILQIKLIAFFFGTIPIRLPSN